MTGAYGKTFVVQKQEEREENGKNEKSVEIIHFIGGNFRSADNVV